MSERDKREREKERERERERKRTIVCERVSVCERESVCVRESVWVRERMRKIEKEAYNTWHTSCTLLSMYAPGPYLTGKVLVLISRNCCRLAAVTSPISISIILNTYNSIYCY